MAEKDKIAGFIQQLYGENKSQTIPKEKIISRLSSDVFPADVEILFKELPQQSYNEGKLIDDLNSIISKRGREQALGGKISI